MRVDFLQGKMAICKPHTILEAAKKKLDCRVRLLAVWTFEVTILDNRDEGAARADQMISRADWTRELE
jgi:hypothetical protein